MGTWRGTMAWGCPGTVPSQDHLCWRGGGEQGQSLCQAAPCPGRAGSQACAPWEPGGSVALILALSASPLAGVPLPLSEIPHCLCQTLLVRAAAAGLGRAGSFVEPLPGSRLFTLQPPSPNRSVRSTWLLLEKYFPLRCGMLFPGQSQQLPGWLQSQAGIQEPTGAACWLSPASLKAFPGRLHTEPQGQAGSHSLLLPGSPACPQARVRPRCCRGRARAGPGTGSGTSWLGAGPEPAPAGLGKAFESGSSPG